ncbi:unnamed protein product, partial [Discosporangium mesarthrocarpum]
NRKKRSLPADLTPPDAVSTWVCVSSQTVHKTNPAGVTCLDLHPSD